MRSVRIVVAHACPRDILKWSNWSRMLARATPREFLQLGVRWN
jgi:hypothetical protein